MNESGLALELTHPVRLIGLAVIVVLLYYFWRRRHNLPQHKS